MTETGSTPSPGNGAALHEDSFDVGADADVPLPHADEPEESGPTRALTMHLLRMLETRMDAAGIALNSEIQTFSLRLQLKLLAAGALFIAIWGGIVLLAIVLPDPYRGPVLGLVVAGFVGLAIWAHLAAKRSVSTNAVGSLGWFLNGLKLDFEVLSRTLAARPPSPDKRSTSSDLAS